MNKSSVCRDIIATMKREMQDVLTQNILPFWLDKMQDHENGGFYGRMDGQGQLYPEAEKGAILNARILWAFSAAYRYFSRFSPLTSRIIWMLPPAPNATSSTTSSTVSTVVSIGVWTIKDAP